MVNGGHDVDAGWMDDVRDASKNKNKSKNMQFVLLNSLGSIYNLFYLYLLVLPRILFDKFSDKDFSNLFTHADRRAQVIQIILQTCNRYSFDGIVLEIWSQLAARIDDEHLIGFVKDIGKSFCLCINFSIKHKSLFCYILAQSLKKDDRQMILVVPPARKEMYDLFSRSHFEELFPYVTAFSLMTYDFSSFQRPGKCILKFLKYIHT